jgi:hypothetical protein
MSVADRNEELGIDSEETKKGQFSLVRTNFHSSNPLSHGNVQLGVFYTFRDLPRSESKIEREKNSLD